MSRLIVVVPGLNGKKAEWELLINKLLEEPDLKGSDWFFYSHNLGKFGLARLGSVEALGLDLKAFIDAKWEKHGGYENVMLLGHSIGGVLVRHAYLLALGEYPDQPQPYDWGRRVNKIILFAALNRGFDPTNVWYGPLITSLFQRLGIFKKMIGNGVIQGADFITDLRIRWIRKFACMGSDAPTVVQLLGTRDGYVKRHDSIDIEQFANGYSYDVRGANHSHVHRIDVGTDEDKETHYAVIRKGILTPNIGNTSLPEAAEKDMVVFVLHGMHAGNDGWVEEVRERLEARAPKSVVVTSSYGFVTALDYIFPRRRRQHLRWFQDQYAYFFAHHPQAEFHFIGHSNGTYILGHSLLLAQQITWPNKSLQGTSRQVLCHPQCW